MYFTMLMISDYTAQYTLLFKPSRIKIFDSFLNDFCQTSSDSRFTKIPNI